MLSSELGLAFTLNMKVACGRVGALLAGHTKLLPGKSQANLKGRSATQSPQI